MRRTGRLGRAARARVRAGGKLAVGRASLSLKAWGELKRRVFERQGYRCLVCPDRARDPHHVVKKSAGGADHESNVVGLCRRHHEQTDWPYAKGRLVILRDLSFIVLYAHPRAARIVTDMESLEALRRLGLA